MAKNSTKANTNRGVETLLKAGIKGEYAAGNSLYLSVNGAGVGSWIYRYQLNDKRKRIGLGSTKKLTLAKARIELSKQKALVLDGRDPLAVRAAMAKKETQEKITFAMVADDYIAAQRSGWKNAKHAQQWTNTIATYASPVIGHLQPSEITTEHVLEILQPIWNTKHETARRVRNRIELILNAAKARKLRTGENVAAWRGHLELLLAKHDKKTKKHHPALPYDQINNFYLSIKNDTDVSAQALMLTVLTGLRTSEVINATWQEMDLNKAIWIIPAERMKAGKPHRVPLSKQALDLLAQIPVTQSGLLFEGKKLGKPISNMAMLMKVRGLGWRDKNGDVITVHGFRSTFRDWAAECTNFPNMIAEQCLAHAVGSAVEQAYKRSDLLERRRALMQAWADYVTAPAVDNVIQLKWGA